MVPSVEMLKELWSEGGRDNRSVLVEEHWSHSYQ